MNTVIFMHQSFVTTTPLYPPTYGPPNLRCRVGDSGANVRGNNFVIVPTVWGKWRDSNRMDEWIYTPVEFAVI